MKILVLASRSVALNNLLMSDLDSPLMIPFKGRPLFYTFQEMFPDSILNYAVGEGAVLTKDLIWNQSKNTNVISVPESVCSGTTGDVLLYSLNVLEYPENLLVLYGDNVYEFTDKNFSLTKNLIFTHEVFEQYERYSYFTEIKNHVFLAQKFGVMRGDGTFEESFSEQACLNTGALWITKTLSVDRSPGMEILDLCSEIEFEVEYLNAWKDLGRADLILRETFDFPSRKFNTVRRSKDGSFITKTSRSPKLLKEFNHLNSIPYDLKYLFPRVGQDFEDNAYQIEFWPFRALSEYYCFWQLHKSVWSDVFQRIFGVINNFLSQTAFVDAQNLETLSNVYSQMLEVRTSEYSDQLKRILELPTVSFNGKSLIGFQQLRGKLNRDLSRIGSTINPSFYHGDFFLGNILYSPESGTIKLIDPKGSLLESHSSLGDVRYDLAKLSHSVIYGYDFINYGFAKFKETSFGEYSLRITALRQTWEIQKIFKEIILANLDVASQKDVLLLTSMLFFNMVPLHEESEDDQKSYLLIGLAILNDYYTASSIEPSFIWNFLD